MKHHNPSSDFGSVADTIVVQNEQLIQLNKARIEQTDRHRKEDSDAAVKAKKEKSEADIKADNHAKDTKRFQLEELRDDRFQAVFAFTGKVFPALAGNNKHTQSAMRVISLFASTFTLASQLSRKDKTIARHEEQLEETQEKPSDPKKNGPRLTFLSMH